MENLLPRPEKVQFHKEYFTLESGMTLASDEELLSQSSYLKNRLLSGAGISLHSSEKSIDEADIILRIIPDKMKSEAYRLVVDSQGIVITGTDQAGLFYGVQTLLQLMPPEIYGDQQKQQNRDLSRDIPCGTIEDSPAYPWRGAMLDVARHFFSPDQVKRYIDLMAYHKLNKLHLHLSDDQGFRLMINSRPDLALVGGRSQVGGEGGGYYSQQQYREILQYAAERFITIIPEIDMPGHSNAILTSYPQLNPDGVVPAAYEDVFVLNSCLNLDIDFTYQIVEDIIRELAELTPGPYIHIGGDEVFDLPQQDYADFIIWLEGRIEYYGKTMIGWEEIAKAPLSADNIVQFWHDPILLLFARENENPIIYSEASFSYLDMKYNSSTPLGQNWAGEIDTAQTYKIKDRMRSLKGNFIGIEAPLWTEFIYSMEDIEYMAFPRLAVVAELAWSGAAAPSYKDLQNTLGYHGLRLEAMGVNYYRSNEVNWIEP